MVGVVIRPGLLWGGGESHDRRPNEMPGAMPWCLEGRPLDREEADAVLARIDAKAGEIHTLAADFEQRRYTPLLKEPLVSEGLVRVVPTMTRWDTHLPRASIMVSDATTLKIYDPEARILEIYEMEERLTGLMFSPMPRTSQLRRYFELEVMAAERANPNEAEEESAGELPGESIYCIRLTPRQQWSQHVQWAMAEIDADRGVLRRVAWADPDGDRTEIRFAQVKLNEALSPDGLALALPGDVKIVRPLEALSGE